MPRGRRTGHLLVASDSVEVPAGSDGAEDAARTPSRPATCASRQTQERVSVAVKGVRDSVDRRAQRPLQPPAGLRSWPNQSPFHLVPFHGTAVIQIDPSGSTALKLVYTGVS